MTTDPATERAHLIAERLGMVCGAAQPTAQQLRDAEAAALRRWPDPAPESPVVATQRGLFGGGR